MVSTSNPFDVYKASLELNSIKNFLYGFFATKFLVNKFYDNFESFEKFSKKENIQINHLKIKLSTTTFEFDKQVTAKFFKESHIDSQ